MPVKCHGRNPSAKSFFDALVIDGVVLGESMRAVQPMTQPATTNASGMA
jgi:hypothetical protein